MTTRTAGAGGTRPHHPPTVRLELCDHAVVLSLRKEAARRDVSVRQLIVTLIDTIARDGLTAAVLDADTVPDD